MNVFENYAHYYDLLYADKDYKAECNYIVGTLNKFFPSAKTILSLGCGTGKHELLLSANGFPVTGIDRSKEMIVQARRNGEKEKNATFLTGDVRSKHLGKLFDAVISLFHVANYQNTDEDILSFFKTAASHLKTDGIFIFDSWHGPAVLVDPPYKRTKEFSNKEVSIKRTAIPVHRKEKNIVEVNFLMEITDHKTGKKKEFHEVHIMRYLFPEEVTRMLQSSGFKLVHSGQWMTGLPPSDLTWYVTYVAKKI